MNNYKRIAAVFIGIMVATLVIWAIETLGLALFPHPKWMAIASIAVVPLFAFVGGYLVKQKPAAANV